MIKFLFQHWQVTILVAGAFIAAQFAFYTWADQRGYARSDAKWAAANLEATKQAGDANRAALGRELVESNARTRAESEIKHGIQDHKGADDDAPAPAIDQHFYDSLRSSTADRPH